MNKVVLIGRLVRDPELRIAPNTGLAVTRITLAVDRTIKKEGQPDADFIGCVAFGKRAEVIAQYLSKGKLVGISGSIRTGSYEKDGVKRYTTDIAIDEFQFLEKAGNSESRGQESGGFVDNPYEMDVTPIDDDDIPF